LAITVRTLSAEADTLQWMISDQLGSTSTTANADGTWNSDIRYTAFGEIRFKSGVTATGYRYTGQLDMQGSIGWIRKIKCAARSPSPGGGRPG